MPLPTPHLRLSNGIILPWCLHHPCSHPNGSPPSLQNSSLSTFHSIGITTTWSGHNSLPFQVTLCSASLMLPSSLPWTWTPFCSQVSAELVATIWLPGYEKLQPSMTVKSSGSGIWWNQLWNQWLAVWALAMYLTSPSLGFLFWKTESTTALRSQDYCKNKWYHPGEVSDPE